MRNCIFYIVPYIISWALNRALDFSSFQGLLIASMYIYLEFCNLKLGRQLQIFACFSFSLLHNFIDTFDIESD